MRRRVRVAALMFIAVVAVLALSAVASAAPQIDRVFGFSYVPKGGDGTDVVTGAPIPNGHFAVFVNALSAPGRQGAGTLWFDIVDLSTPVIWRGTVNVECVSVFTNDAGNTEAMVGGTLRHPMNWEGVHLDHVNFDAIDYGPNPTAPDPFYRYDYWEASFAAGNPVVYDPSNECRVDGSQSTVTAGTFSPWGSAVFGNFFFLNGF